MSEVPATCRHGISTEDQDAWNCAFCEIPDHLIPAGSPQRRHIRKFLAIEAEEAWAHRDDSGK